jgi:putative membrane protein
MPLNRTRWLIASSILLLIVLAISAIKPYEYGTWALEVAPVVIALPILFATYQRFPLTTLLYLCIFAHSIVLIVGGTYTYARVPLGFELQELLGLDRNPYDKIGHFMQGFAPVIVAREILIRGNFVRGRRMLVFLCLCVVMAISAVYELIEWWVALAAGQGAVEFLGTQGDPWDTQSDMFFALIGAVASLLLLSRAHDRQVQAIAPNAAVENSVHGSAGAKR